MPPDAEKQFVPYTGKPATSEQFDEAFKIEKPRYNDKIFLVFFLLVFMAFFVVTGIVLNAARETWSYQGGLIYHSLNTFSLNSNTAILFGFVIVIAVVLSFLINLFARVHAKAFITSGLILNIILGLATGIYYLVMHYWSAGIVFMVFTVISALCYWRCRSRISFSAIVLEIAIDVMRRYKSTLIVSFCGIVISGAFSALFLMVVVGCYIKYSPAANNPGCNEPGGTCSKGSLIGILVFVFFAGYYITEVMKNVIHVTIAGIYGTWYYLAGSDQGEPKWPALGSFKRAMTYCFGSICFGSLIVSIIQFIRGLVQALRTSSFENGDICAGCGFLILDLILGFLNWLVEYFNHYAYVFVALYGKPYIQSAKSTFNLIRHKGMDALINDCFVNTALQLYALFVAYVAVLFSWFFLKYTNPEYNRDGAFNAPVMTFSFVIAAQVTRISLAVIESGVSTFFVALANDPEVFQMTNRDRFDEIFRNYPQVVQKLLNPDDIVQQQQQYQPQQQYLPQQSPHY
ncbi:hypothetical protein METBISCDRAFT_18486 [Metschnikowia bicuspidata]|uniref:Protein PNS1 n=1 Tax=Metschnikowia bicuspidata TaxID=27322 RepID=A0A4P9Z9R7_9ASCO|nr:hypothetical protein METBISCDRAFT_18486 [Metschnikowia bicuspidata]